MRVCVGVYLSIHKLTYAHIIIYLHAHTHTIINWSWRWAMRVRVHTTTRPIARVWVFILNWNMVWNAEPVAHVFITLVYGRASVHCSCNGIRTLAVAVKTLSSIGVPKDSRNGCTRHEAHITARTKMSEDMLANYVIRMDIRGNSQKPGISE
jgi:hypothetical protein